MRLLLNRRAMRGAPMTTLIIPGAERAGEGLSDISASRAESGQGRH